MDERAARHRTQGQELETSLADLEARLEVAERSLKQASTSLRNALDAARKGRLRELPKLLAAGGEAARGFADRAVEAEHSWSFPVEAHLSSEDYLAEVQRLANNSGLAGVRVVDGQLFSYPVIVKVDARDLSLRLGKKVHRELRPSHLVRTLQEARSHPVKENLGPVLQMIEKAYLRLTHGEPGRAVPIADDDDDDLAAAERCLPDRRLRRAEKRDQRGTKVAGGKAVARQAGAKRLGGPSATARHGT